MANNTTKPVSVATLLRQKLESGSFIFAPGVYDGFSARIALSVGFDALYMVCLYCIAKHGLKLLPLIAGLVFS